MVMERTPNRRRRPGEHASDAMGGDRCAGGGAFLVAQGLCVIGDGVYSTRIAFHVTDTRVTDLPGEYGPCRMCRHHPELAGR